MKKFWNKYHEKIIVFLIFITIFVGVISIISIFSGAIMKIFGFEYKSVGSIILFFIIATIISFPMSLTAEIFPKILLSYKVVSKQAAVLIYILFDTIATSFGLSVVDYFMESISATDLSIIIISFLLALGGIKDIDKKPGE